MNTLVMTGATRGLGRAAAAEVLLRDPETHLVVLARGGSSAAMLPELRAISEHVTVIDADLANVADVRDAAGTITRLLDAGDLPPLHGFAGNAGVSYADATHTTPEGYETTFAVNVLANHVLLRALAPRFVAPARVVITVSDAHFGDFRHSAGTMPAPRWSDPATLARPGAFDKPQSAGMRAYATSKLGAIYLVHEWARRLPAGVEIVSYNPSLVPDTGLTRNASPAMRFTARWIAPLLTFTPLADTSEGAGRKLAAVILGQVTAPSGSYIDRTRATPSSTESYDPDRERELWDFADAIV